MAPGIVQFNSNPSTMPAPVPALFPSYKPFAFEMARGVGDQVFSTDGRVFIDLYGGHCVCATGHSHPRVVEAIAQQARELLFYSAAGELEIRKRAAEALIRFAGAPMASVFFCNSGAEANENALKVAHLKTERKKFAAMRGGWHGRTTLALGVTDDPKITDPYRELLPECVRLDPKASLEVDWSEVAALILEPIRSMSGIQTYDQAWLQQAVAQAQTAGALVIFDEIQTGMGRLGAPFAFNKWGFRPDMVTSAKGLASGVPMGALMMSEAVAQSLGPGDLGSTFGGGPLACAALIATLAIIEEENLCTKALQAEQLLRDALRCPVRGEGLLLGIEVGANAAAMAHSLFEKGFLVGKASDPNVLRIMPPLMIAPSHLAKFAEEVNALL